MSLSPLYTVPLELLGKIIDFLPARDQLQFSLVSKFAREVAVQHLFSELHFTGRGWFSKLRDIYPARAGVKAAVRSIRLQFPNIEHPPTSRTLLFKSLSTFPNLQSLQCLSTTTVLSPSDLPLLFSALQNSRLSALTLRTDRPTPVVPPIFPGPSGLKKLFITWCFSDTPDSPGSSIKQLYAIVRPSLSTLVALEIQNKPQRPGDELDLRLLKSAGDTLRSFEYTIPTLDEGVLDTIADTFPHLSKLAVEWSNSPAGHSVPWDDSHINPLALLPNLTHLALSSDFEQAENDILTSHIDFDCWGRCQARRKAATEKIAKRCEKLKSCTWLQVLEGARLTYPFTVERGKTGEVQVELADLWMMRSSS